jgi:hypothetical protein
LWPPLLPTGLLLPLRALQAGRELLEHSLKYYQLVQELLQQVLQVRPAPAQLHLRNCILLIPSTLDQPN